MAGHQLAQMAPVEVIEHLGALRALWDYARDRRAAAQTLHFPAPPVAAAADRPDAGVALRAATAALDRASKLTAPKGTPVTIHGLDDAIKRIYGHDPAEVPGDDDDP